MNHAEPRPAEVPEPDLPLGCRLVPLTPHDDSRGRLTELFREVWGTGVDPVQWNAVRSEANVLRGVHVHTVHDDYLTVPWGRMLVGLRDLRDGSSTCGLTALVELAEGYPAALVVPRGVAHGFWIPEPSMFVYAVTHYWDPDDELGCHWADPELEIAWPCSDPILSDRDTAAPPLSVLLKQIESAQPFV